MAVSKPNFLPVKSATFGPLGIWFLKVVSSVAIITWIYVAGPAVANHSTIHNYLLSWIPAACCVTNDCCWQVSEREVTPLPGDMWRINSTGQELKRTDWSPDGKYYRCACDYDMNTGKWNKHQGAATRCLFVPMSLF